MLGISGGCKQNRQRARNYQTDKETANAPGYPRGFRVAQELPVISPKCSRIQPSILQKKEALHNAEREWPRAHPVPLSVRKDKARFNFLSRLPQLRPHKKG